MGLDIATFRDNFPEFASINDYPDTMMTFWLSMGSVYVSEAKWGDYYNIGMSLVLAHLLTIAGKNKSSGKPGSGNEGLINNQSVGDVSAGFDTASTIEERGGQWNLTSYGQQFYRMSRMIGGCAVQI